MRGDEKVNVRGHDVASYRRARLLHCTKAILPTEIPLSRVFGALQQISFALPQNRGKYPVTARALFSTLATT
ncbi:hypothetical protein [Bordetella petrii]|uniref:hypothetical protein n=1 Tax=Bordetella petrii TaxID=94624 RepID=UPI0012DE8A61|nr:hypothetical protein [Bordetella petrii]